MIILAQQIGEDNSIYHYDKEAIDALNVAKPWKEDPWFFKKVRISGEPNLAADTESWNHSCLIGWIFLPLC